MESDDKAPRQITPAKIKLLGLPILVLLDIGVEHRLESEDVLVVHPLEEIDFWTDRLELENILERVLLLSEAVVRWDNQS